MLKKRKLSTLGFWGFSLLFEKCCPLTHLSRSARFAHSPKVGWGGGLAFTSMGSFTSSLKCNYLAVYGLWTAIQYIEHIFWISNLLFWWFWTFIPVNNLRLAPLDHTVVLVFSSLFCNSGLSRVLIYEESSEHPYLSVRHMYTFPDK